MCESIYSVFVAVFFLVLHMQIPSARPDIMWSKLNFKPENRFDILVHVNQSYNSSRCLCTCCKF
jgi:hypothetical protein